MTKIKSTSALTLAKSFSRLTRSGGVHRLQVKDKESKTRGKRKEKVHWQVACKLLRKQMSMKSHEKVQQDEK